jgi:hypothetical protein
MTLTLDIPFQGADVSIAIGSTEYIAAADVATSEMGVKITGVASEFDTGKMHYYPGTSWSLNLRDFGTTTLTNSVAQDPGKGVYEQVAELEFFMQGNGGNTMRAPEPHVFTRRSSAVVGATYDLYEIAYTTKEERGYGAMHAPKHITVAAITGAGTWVNAAGTGFVDTIEKLTGKTF